jgi:murein L,D-transpeptidase YcbB/YkuD
MDGLRGLCRRPGGATIAVLGLVTALAGPAAAAGDTQPVRRAIAALTETAADPGTHADPAVPARIAPVYRARNHRPVWLRGDGNRAERLIAELRAAGRDGLRPAAYTPDRLAGLVRRADDPRGRARADLRLSAAFVAYATDLRRGRVPPEVTGRPPVAQAPRRLGARLLAKAAASDDLDAVFDDLVPGNAVYRDLREVMARYRAIAGDGGWPRVPTGRTLERGMADNTAVPALRARLAATGDLDPAAAPDAGVFGAALEAAVKRFQARHGLAVDGIVGRKTYRALNVPVAARIRQIAVNMERWRWLPADLGERSVRVNIAGFTVDVIRHGETVLSMRAVVGTPYRKTPVFTGRMTYIDVNPTWTVPPTILKTDILPELRADPGYLAEHDMTLYAGWQADSPVVDPETIDWSTVSADAFPYRIVQAPGPTNPLGRVKFMFPNRHHVYLHDTPKRGLFEKNVRTFSSGCIRVERPVALAAELLDGVPGWSRARIADLMAAGTRKRVRLPDPWPVHVTYTTVWRAADGTIQFRNDIYGRDKRLARMLFPEQSL